MKIKDLIRDDDIYPRQQLSQKTISAYSESLKAGAKFPLILTQEIKDNNGEKTILLDGVHRIEAYKLNGIEEIEVIHWKKEILDKDKSLMDLRIKSIQENLKHGDRLGENDNKFNCSRMAEADPKITLKYKDFAEIFGVTEMTVSDWIKAIRARQKASRDNLIYRLNMLGWTQREIAKQIGVDHSTISNILLKSKELYKFTKTEYSQGKSIEEIAEFYGLDLTLTRAILLEGKTDEKRAEELDINIRKFTVWNFSSCHPLMGRESFKGRIPGEIPFNAMHWFSKQGDLVVDPMVGSGTTLDAALLLGRRAYGYDINPREDRKDIIENDIWKGIPLKKQANFIFCNAPYWNMISYGEGLSEDKLSKFYDGMSKLAEECFKHIKQNGYVAILMGNQSWQKLLDQRKETKGLHRIEHVLTTIELFLKQNFKLWWRIYCPLTTQEANSWAESEWALGKLADITRELLVFKKT